MIIELGLLISQIALYALVCSLMTKQSKIIDYFTREADMKCHGKTLEEYVYG